MRHAELFIEQLGLNDAKSVNTPGVSTTTPEAADSDQDDDDCEIISPSDACAFRAITARCNYLQPDRPDIQYAVKEVCRLMSKPTRKAFEMLKIIGRYLRGTPRLIWQYGLQTEQEIIEVHSDANWAGCKRSRKSSLGGTICLGNHPLKAYSRTQAVIAKSELYGVIRASTEALGVPTLLEDFGMPGVKVRVGMDASAAMGIVQRRGLNKLRHVELDVLWIQEQQARRLLPLRKVPGPLNPSDMMTKNIGQSQIEVFLDVLNLKHAEGRADIAQKLDLMGEKLERPATSQPKEAMPDDVHALVRSAAARSVSQSVGADPSRGRSQISPEMSNSTAIGPGRKKDAEIVSELNRLHFESFKMPRPAADKAADRHVDSWGREGKEGRWTRIHRSARRALFTPFKVASGPNLKTSTLKRIRITRGIFFASGKTFKVIDDWAIRANAHRVLEGSWMGTTDFRETSEFIDDDSGEDQEEKEEAAEEREDLVK